MRVSLIVAMSRNRVIGKSGGLPWRLPADLKRFKQLTMGHHLIMGRATFESIGRLLPGRTTVVTSRQADYHPAGASVASSLEAAFELSGADDEVFVVGGGQIYQAALPRVDRMYVTLIEADLEGDTWFPRFNEADWDLVLDETHPADEKNEYAYRFRRYDRRQ